MANPGGANDQSGRHRQQGQAIGAGIALNALGLTVAGVFAPHSKASIEAFQAWRGVTVDGIVGDQIWSVSLHAASSTVETAVG